MFGAILGLACGAAELLLLQIIVRNVVNGGNIPLWAPLAKLAALAFCLVLCLLIAPGELAYAGAGIAAALVFGSLGKFAVGMQNEKKEKEASLKAGDDAI